MSWNPAYKYRCMTCEGSPWLDPEEGETNNEAATRHLDDNATHEISFRIIREEVIE